MSVDLRQEWETPSDFWEVINREFEFQLDACASARNRKVDAYYTRGNDGLASHWSPRTWCNPGFSNSKPWFIKALYEASRDCLASDGLGFDAHMVVMGRVNPSTKTWNTWGLRASEIRLLSPRVQFIAPPGVKQTTNPQENALFIYRYNPHNRPPDIWTWKWK